MAAKTWESDFRYPAILASVKGLGSAYHEDPFQYPGSFCLPVAERPVLGWTPGRLMLVALVLGFALLIAGALLATQAEKAPPGTMSALMLTVAACSSISGIVMFMLPLKLDRQMICWLIGERAWQLFHHSPQLKRMGSELSDASEKSRHKMSIDGDDHVLIVFDIEQERLILEGIGARYQIRAADVSTLTPFQFMNYLGAEIEYRIDAETSLRLLIARPSLLLEFIRQVPILYFLANRIPNKILLSCMETLRRQDAAKECTAVGLNQDDSK